MARIIWDEATKHYYETGVKQCVFYKQAENGDYPLGVAWNGITSVSESPSGADTTDLYADDTKYLSLRANEDFGATIEAYTFPDEFAECDGFGELTAGVRIGQQTRKAFGLCYRTAIGNDVDYQDHGYKLHLIYNATVSPSERSYQTINDSPEAITFSWELTTIPINVTGFKPTACVTIDSTKVNAEKLAAFEAIIYGDAENEARLPLPDEVKTLLTA